MEIFHQNITILIQDMAGGVIPIEIGPETKVRDVKWLLRAINGVSVWRQCLTVMHSDEDYVILDDTHTVSSSRVADGATVYVVVATFDSILADFVRNHPPANGITVGWFPVIFQDIMHETASNFFHPGFAKWIHLRFLDDWLKTGYTNFVGDQRDQRQTWLLVFYWFYMTFLAPESKDSDRLQSIDEVYQTLRASEEIAMIMPDDKFWREYRVFE